ncbi:MAG TPA: alpha/beta hydrolase [Mycobacterium sp.]|nr:alpha/beta hydrolase [Mycobacterium sp.]HZA10318.1 alpha/beta hydrolase [Mycobacterium sp.]
MWFMRARPADYLLALSTSYAALPVVGKHLEPLGALTAMGVWGYRHAPDFVASAVQSKLAGGAAELRKQANINEVGVAALRGIVAADELNLEWPTPDRLAPLLRYSQQRRHYVFRTSVRYGDAPQQELDVWRLRRLPAEPAPVLIFVPGGAWVHGRRLLQGYALMSHLAEQGWVCLSIDYRVSPHHPWPRHVNDVKAAIAWARANVDRFGGDRDFVAVAGCSAGGHLAALAGLTPDDASFRGELPADSDTSVDAAVGIYGRYDWEDRSTAERERFMDFLERVVVKKRYDRHPELFRAASPIARVRPDAPPFLVVHGSSDTVIPVAQARAFAERLRSTSRSPVGYLELPGAHHGFDLTDGARTASAMTVIGLFLNEIHRSHVLSRAKEVI